RDNISMEEGKKALIDELQKIAYESIDKEEFQKVKNKFESTMTFSQIKALERAMNLCYFEYLGDIDHINKEVDCYQELTIDFIQKVARETFVDKKSNTLYYETKE
ncbi:MAG: insulinase family protein, partial [Bacteroidales bacterium]|nr:insulinase family protein [Bacteroidales bacterium]